ncbi:MAG: hypothetical protein M3024_03545 [Candidatus Dormibacteraeota bacterium]|nr:hypothetical protein [Candidatus Dormibacteraeota bacterium]
MPKPALRRRMNTQRVGAALLAAVLVTSCTGSGSSPSRPPPTGAAAAVARSPGCGQSHPTAAGGDRRYILAIDPALAGGATQRTAVVHIPAGYRPDVAVPLVVQFHGAAPNATGEGYELDSPLHRLSDSEGFIDAFPQGLRAPNGNLAWNAYGPVLVKIAEIPFVNQLLDAIAADYCVDRSRVYASGVSNGGNMVNYLACRDAGRFAAVAPVVGPMFGQDDGPCRPARPVPIIDIHGLDDPAVPYGGHPVDAAHEFALPSVPAWLQGWAQLDGCSPAPPEQAGPDGVLVRTWTRCRAGARIVAYSTHAGHGWPADLAGRPAAATVWEFLSGFRDSAVNTP